MTPVRHHREWMNSQPKIRRRLQFTSSTPQKHQHKSHPNDLSDKSHFAKIQEVKKWNIPVATPVSSDLSVSISLSSDEYTVSRNETTCLPNLSNFSSSTQDSMEDFCTESPLCSTAIDSSMKSLFSGSFMDESRPEPTGMEDPDEEADDTFHATIKSAISSRVAAMLDLSYSSPCVAMAMSEDYDNRGDLACCSECNSNDLQVQTKFTKQSTGRTSISQARTNDLQRTQGHSTKQLKVMSKEKRRSLAKKLKQVGQMLHFGKDDNNLQTLALF